MADQNALLTVTQAAKRLGVSPNTLRAWADRGAIPVLRLPSGHRRFEAAALDALRPRVGASDESPNRASNGSSIDPPDLREARKLTSDEKQRGLRALTEMERLSRVFEAKYGAPPAASGRSIPDSNRVAAGDDELEPMDESEGAMSEEWRQSLCQERSEEEWAEIEANTEAMFQLADEIAARRKGPPGPDSVEIIREMREERTRELMRAHGWENWE